MNSHLHPSVLVTGGAGYIGLHTCKALEQAGFSPCILDDFSSGQQDLVRWPCITGDIKKRWVVELAFRMFKPVAVIHLAALIQVGESVTQPQKYYENNVEPIFGLLRTMRKYNCYNLVFASSAAVYGEQGAFELSNPTSPYGQAKKMVELVLRDCAHSLGLTVFALRYFNVAGADLDNEFGETHDPETHIIPLILRTTVDNPLKLFGTDFNTPDGTAIRDYIHVSDVASANVKAVEFLVEFSKSGPDYFTMDIGYGEGVSLFELIATAEDALIRKIPTETYVRRSGDPERLVATKDAGGVINWHPQYTLRQMIETANAWENKNA